MLVALISLLRGFVSSPRFLFLMAIVAALVSGGCEIDRRATKRERAAWLDRVAAAEARVREVERATDAKIADAIKRAAEHNRRAIDAETMDKEAIRADLARTAGDLNRCRVSRAVVVRLDAGPGRMPNSAIVAGGPRSGTDPAVSRPAADGVDLAALVVRARELSGVAERNAQRLAACLSAYETARQAAIAAGGR